MRPVSTFGCSILLNLLAISGIQVMSHYERDALEITGCMRLASELLIFFRNIGSVPRTFTSGPFDS